MMPKLSIKGKGQVIKYLGSLRIGRGRRPLSVRSGR